MLKEGDKAPDFSLETQDGKRASLRDLAPAGKTLVLFFYPKDSTPGCTREAQAFTASRKAIEKAGGVIAGISRDSVKSHNSFRDKFKLDVTLLSDPERKAHEAYGAWGEKTMYGKKVLGAIRSTFLVKDGKVVRVFPNVKVDGHADQVLAALSGESAPAAKKATPKKAAATKAAPKKAAAKPAAKKAAAAKPAKKVAAKKPATTKKKAGGKRA
ncbi:Thiol peroxidase, Bcp-type [Labilithrix luteola]|uniref:thioredoxin-dependent peroxiredoxin n=1 Tax=Labilithrix luteola TaxID=1391654 RepID=A0A0K1Q5E9_9BACT|nr:Thiol peroxidase, Bcp-type [Labilithrix luteola]